MISRPTFLGFPQSMLVRATPVGTSTELWVWWPTVARFKKTSETIEILNSQGFQQAPTDEGERYFSYLAGQCCEVVYIDRPEDKSVESWARSDDLEHVKQRPVILSFPLPEGITIPDTGLIEGVPPDLSMTPMLQFLPPPALGEYSIIAEGNTSTIYTISQLPETAHSLWIQMGEALRALASPGIWAAFEPTTMEVVSNPRKYHQAVADKRSEILRRKGQAKEDAKDDLAHIETAYEQVSRIRIAEIKTDWDRQWEAVKRMTRELAEAYYLFHQTSIKRAKLTGLPAITSTQTTALPSSNGFRGLMQSFGPGLQPDLWNEETSVELRLNTPNQSLLRVMGKNEHEHKALHHYIVDEMGVEGLKHLVVILDAYYTQSGARDQKEDAVVSLRQLLIHMGYGNRADVKEEQQKLMHSILYLSRTWISSAETSYEREPRGRGRKRSHTTDYSPLIVLEALRPSKEGGIQLPEAVIFHLGKEFYELLFGERKHYFTLPTAQILLYHAERQQQELCLGFYLSNFLNINYGKYQVHFTTMVIESGIRMAGDIERSEHRTRDALRVIYALERLQKDGWIKRERQSDIDMALGVELVTGVCKQDDLAEETHKRLISPSYAYLNGLSPLELRRKRREALQRLLNGESEKLTFSAGSLLKAQVEKREKQRQDAIDHSEHAQIARVVKTATKQVMSNIAKTNGEK